MFRAAPFDPHRHQAADFTSGEPELDDWLREHAGRAEERRLSRTFVWIDDSDHVRAYYTLVAHKITREALPVTRGEPREVPAVLLAKLALDEELHGDHLGGALLAEALGRIVDAAKIVAARYVVVDALHERAATFYEHYGFQRLPGLLRLVRRVDAIASDITRVPTPGIG